MMTETTDDGVEVRIKLRGELRQMAEDHLSMWPAEHEDAKGTLDRNQSHIVLESADEARAVDELMDRVSELNAIKGNQKSALKRVNTELVKASGEFVLA